MGAAVTITKERYVDMLEHNFQDEQDSELWFQLDGAPAHTSRMAMDWLNSGFQNKLISNKYEFS